MIEIWAPLCIAALVLVYLLADKLGWHDEARARDLALFLRHVDLQTLGELLDPATEATLRSELSARAFRCRQRSRIIAAKEQIGRMHYNAGIFRSWGTGKYKRIAVKNRGRFGDEEQLIVAVIKVADEMRSAAFRALLKLTFWRVCLVHIWPFLPSPSLSDVREALGADLLTRYEALISSVGMLLLGEDEGDYETVRAAL